MAQRSSGALLGADWHVLSAVPTTQGDANLDGSDGSPTPPPGLTEACKTQPLYSATVILISCSSKLDALHCRQPPDNGCMQVCQRPVDGEHPDGNGLL